MIIERKLVKHFTIGELSFDLAINRKMAAEGFKAFPKYWEMINKSDLIKKATKADSGEMVDTSNLPELIEITAGLEEEGYNIVNYLLPKMLEYAETNGNGNKREYADKILDYCDENDCLVDYVDEDTDEAVKGFVSVAMEFVVQGFTSGGEKRKSKVKVIVS